MTHDDVREMVRRVNPIPDPNMLESVDAPVLTTERRTDMQTDDRVEVNGRGQSRRRGPLVGVAVAAAILVAGAIYFLSNDDPPVATPAPNATRLLGESEPIEPGAYYADTDGNEETSTRGTFVIDGDGWASLEAGVMRDTPEGVDNGLYVALMIVEVNEVWEAPCASGASAPPGTTAEALGDQFAAMSGFTTREAVTPLSAFGRDGYHLVLEVPGGCNTGEHVVWSGGAWGERNYQAEGQIVEYWFLDVEGTTVMVEATRPPESDEEDEEIVTELNADLDAVLETLVITP
jgi:hypothetical protein